MKPYPPLLLALGLASPIAWLAADPAADVLRARAFYRSQPRHLRPVLGDARVAGLTDVSAASCGACHAAIYEEWRASTHARAFRDDAQFEEELKKHAGAEGDHDATWICINCHTPFESQLERLVIGLEDGDLGRPQYVTNPAFDPKLQREAVTCATCHVRDGTIVGPFGNTNASHAVKKDPDLLSSQVCLECHQAVAALDQVELACVFDTGLEHAGTDAARKGETCQSCHMPEVTRSVSNLPPTPPRAGRRHYFGGSLIPKKPEFAKDVAAMRPHFKDGLAAEWVALPEQLAPRTKTALRFALVNANAGHLLPTGDPERFLRVEVSATAADGAVLATRIETIGATYQWNPVKKLADTRLAPGERREYELEVLTPEEGEVHLALKASKWRMNEKNFEYHRLAGRYVAGVPFLALERSIPVRGE